MKDGVQATLLHHRHKICTKAVLHKNLNDYTKEPEKIIYNTFKGS